MKMSIAAVVGLSACGAYGQWSPGPWGVERLGFFDAEHTDSIGAHRSATVAARAVGTVCGTATRYSGTEERGLSAWVYTPAWGVRRVGYWGGQYLAADGWAGSFPTAMAATGHVGGGSNRYITTSLVGVDSWVVRPDGVQVRVGLFDAAHVRPDGYQDSRLIAMGVNGSAYGTSRKFNGSTEVGQSAWHSDPLGVTTRVGYFDQLHTHPLRLTQRSDPRFMNSAGMLCGSSHTYLGSSTTNTGVDAWIYIPGTGMRIIGPAGNVYGGTASRLDTLVGISDEGVVAGYSTQIPSGNSRAWMYNPVTATTTLMGFTGPGWQSNNAVTANFPTHINTAGDITGISAVYNASGTTQIGLAAWLVPRGGTITRLGRFTGAYVSGTGQVSSTIVHLSSGGYVVGRSASYTTPSPETGSVWFYSPTDGLFSMGLTDAEHTQANNVRNTNVSYVTPNGYAYGTTTRITPGSSRDSLWVFSPTIGTVRLGLRDALHTHPFNGGQWSTMTVRGEDGRCAGFSLAFGPDGESVGSTGWYFDPATGVQHELVFEVRASDGARSTEINHISPTGVVYGAYRHYDEQGLSDRAFMWTVEGGLVDLEQEVVGGIGSYGLANTGSVKFPVEHRYIVCDGREPQPARYASLLLRPCPANINGDGSVDGDDVISLFEAWDQGLEDGDFNQDGAVDGDDIIEFFAHWDAGC